MVKMVLMSNLWFEMTVKLVVRDEAHTISMQTQVLNLDIRNMTCFYLPPTISLYHTKGSINNGNIGLLCCYIIQALFFPFVQSYMSTWSVVSLLIFVTLTNIRFSLHFF